MTNKINWMKLGLCVLGCELVGASGAFFTNMSVNTWYKDIAKPFFTPPSWVFGPAWTLLFALMGIALYLILMGKNKPELRRRALNLFTIQFGLNLLWSYLFFGLRMPWLAYAEILVMWLFIFLTIKSFSRLNKLAGWLLVPYILWVTFASFLNLGVAYLN